MGALGDLSVFGCGAVWVAEDPSTSWDIVNRSPVQQYTLEVDYHTFLGGNQKCRQPVCDACHLSSDYPNKLSAFWTPTEPVTYIGTRGTVLPFPCHSSLRVSDIVHHDAPEARTNHGT